MKIVELIQGTPEWHAHRAKHFNASDAPAMMGCSPYKTRGDLLRELHTGVAAEPTPEEQKRYDDGHRFERLSRPLAQDIIGDELYPLTCTEDNGKLSASLDGITLFNTPIWEHKSLNEALRAVLPADGTVGESAVGAALPLVYRVQMEQQLMITGAERCLFTASRWDAGDQLIEARHCWYEPDLELRAQIRAGWVQFAADLIAYVPKPAAEPVKTEALESLPAVSVRLDGALVVHSNLDAFGSALRAFVQRIPAKPSTDTEFATAEAACKALKRAEETLDGAEANALASITDVEQMQRLVGDLRALARTTRLATEKLVERRKREIKEEAIWERVTALSHHVGNANAEIAPMAVVMLAPDWAGAIKGLRSLDSVHDALDTLLANTKIRVDESARLIRENVAAFHRVATGYETLFADLSQLVIKPAPDFLATVESRIAKHKQAEADRQAREAEAKRKAEEAAAAALAAAASKALPEGQEPAQVVKAEAPAPDATAAATPASSSPRAGAMGTGQPAGAGPVAGEKPSLKLGDIGVRLGFPLTRDFVENTLGVMAHIDGRAILFTERQFTAICERLVTHVRKAQAGVPA